MTHKDYTIEALTLSGICFDDNDVAQVYEYTEYLVKRTRDDYPVAQFKTLQQAEEFISSLVDC